MGADGIPLGARENVSKYVGVCRVGEPIHRAYPSSLLEARFWELRPYGVLGSWFWAAPGKYDVLATWATRAEGPSCRQKRTRPWSPAPALGGHPPQERMAPDPPDGPGCLPRLVPGRSHPRVRAAHVRPYCGGHRAGAGGGRARPARGRVDPGGGHWGHDGRPAPVRRRCRCGAGRYLRGAGDGGVPGRGTSA